MGRKETANAKSAAAQTAHGLASSRRQIFPAKGARRQGAKATLEALILVSRAAPRIGQKAFPKEKTYALFDNLSYTQSVLVKKKDTFEIFPNPTQAD